MKPMPHRPPSKTNRRDWNTEPDYHERERERLALVAQIRQTSTRYLELYAVWPGCDTRIWEAAVGGVLFRGCHCASFMAPPGHSLGTTPLDLEAWERIVYQSAGLYYRRIAARN